MISFAVFFFMFLAGYQPDGDFHDAVRLYETGKFQQAVSSFQKLADAAPADPDIRIWLGRSCLKTRQWDKAAHEMEKAVQLQPGNAQYHLWLGRAYGDQASNASFIKAFGWARRVVREFETARKLAPDDLEARFDLLDYYLEAPGIVGGGREKAEAEVQAIARLNAEKGHTARAALYSKDKKWDLARKELQQAVADYPRSVSACKDLADFLLNRNDYEGALEYAKKALLLDGKSKRARLIAAAAQIRLKRDLNEAAESLRTLADGTLGEGDPAFEEVYYWLGECLLAKGDKAGAREAFKSALAFNPDYGRAKDSLSKLK